MIWDLCSITIVIFSHNFQTLSILVLSDDPTLYVNYVTHAFLDTIIIVPAISRVTVQALGNKVKANF